MKPSDGTETREIQVNERLLLQLRSDMLARQVDWMASSRTWRLASLMRTIRNRIAPRDSVQVRILSTLFHRLLPAVRRMLRIRLLLAGLLSRAQGLRVWLAPRGSRRAQLLRRPATSLGLAGAWHSPAALQRYRLWMTLNEPGTEELEAQRRLILRNRPLISVVVPTYNTPPAFLTAMLDSVQEQTYDNWELCIADGNSQNPELRQLLEQRQDEDPRIKVSLLPQNRGIVGNTNAALALATGDYVAFLDHDDTLAPFALFDVAQTLNVYPNADLLYSDEDKLSPDGAQRLEPHFKPAWSPDLLRSNNYISHLAIYRRGLLKQIGGLREGFDGSQDYDLVLRASERSRQIIHIPRVLYHWRIHPSSTSTNTASKPYAYEAGRKALEEHHQRSGREAQVNHSAFPGWYQTTYPLQHRPLVSLVIPNHDQASVLRRCIDSIGRSSYPNYEIVVVENNSREPATHRYYDELRAVPNIQIVNFDREFNFSAAVNLGVRNATGEVVVLLNNDTEVINPDWLERLVEHIVRPEVGAVGAKLYYPNGAIQHAGVMLGLRGIAGHCHYQFPRQHSGYFGRLLAIQNLSAVTGACVAVRKSVYEEVGGFDEDYPLCLNDIDFCLKLRDKGYLIVWTPLAELYHHESLSRGEEDNPAKRRRFQAECALFRRRWGAALANGDPYYNPNFTLNNGSFETETKVALAMPRMVSGPLAA